MSINKIGYKGYTIRIEQDDDPQNPREDGDNLTVMACFHRRYRLGDQEHGYVAANYSGWDAMEADIIAREDPAVILPLYLYDHSGLRIKIGSFAGLLPQGHAEFDSGQVGFVWVTKKVARNNWVWKNLTARRLAQVREYIVKDVALYDDLLSGSVYGYQIDDPDGNEIDASSWGYFGYDQTKEDSNLVSDAKAAVDAEITRREEAVKNDPRQPELPSLALDLVTAV